MALVIPAAPPANKLTPEQQAALKNLHQVAVQFEGIFVSMLLHEMQKGESNNTLFGPKTNGEKIFGSMLDDERAQAMAGTGSFGIAALVESQLRQAVLGDAGREAHTSTRVGLP
jgi:Rod binding domain-containing protein